MACNSLNGNGSIDSPPNELPAEEILSEYDKELDEIVVYSNVIETVLQEQKGTINKLAEQYRNPRDVEIAHQQLQASEKITLLDFKRLLAVEEEHRNTIEKLTEMDRSMLRLWRSFDFLEAEQRSNERKYRQDIEKRRFEIEMSHTKKQTAILDKEVMLIIHQAVIETQKKRLEQCQANQTSLEVLRRKHAEVTKIVEKVKEKQETLFVRLLTMSSLVERNVTTIRNKQMRIAEAEKAAMNGETGPSATQQAANTEEEAKLDVERM